MTSLTRLENECLFTRSPDMGTRTTKSDPVVVLGYRHDMRRKIAPRVPHGKGRISAVGRSQGGSRWADSRRACALSVAPADTGIAEGWAAIQAFPLLPQRTKQLCGRRRAVARRRLCLCFMSKFVVSRCGTARDMPARNALSTAPQLVSGSRCECDCLLLPPPSSRNAHRRPPPLSSPHHRRGS